MNDDAVLLKIGELTGLVSAMSLRIDTMHSDNGIRYTELIEQCADIKAQIHEVKHAQNDAAQKIIILEQKTQAHREADDIQHNLLISNQLELKNDVLMNRNTSAERFDELFTAKNKIFGVAIIIFSLIGLFANQIWESLGHVTHLWGK